MLSEISFNTLTQHAVKRQDSSQDEDSSDQEEETA